MTPSALPLTRRIGRGLAAAGLLIASSAIAGDVEILAAEAVREGERWRISVTLSHADTGWEHYADAWRVVGPDGTVYGTRTLHHPHVEEQPFTRSLGAVTIPDGVRTVRIEARDSLHGWASETHTLALPR